MENVTLVSVLLLILLYIPGHLFKRFYFRGPFSNQFYFGAFAERFITSVFWGIIMQIISVIVTKKFIDFSYENIQKPISEFYSQLCNNQLPTLTYDNICQLGIYSVITLVVSISAGFFAHTLVRLLRIDLYLTALRFQNHWHYYFRGESDNRTSSNTLSGRVLTTEIDILAEDGSGNNKLYSGFLASYTVSNKTGDLDTITLASASRFSNTANQFVAVPGDFLIIKFDNIFNLNLRYNRAEKQPFWRKMLYNVILTLTIASIFLCFYIPTHFSSLGALNVIMADVLVMLSCFSIQIALFTPIVPSSISKRVKSITALFGVMIFLISAICLFVVLQFL